VSWKVTDGIYQHVDVKEERKENMFSLGQSLRIGAEEYEDLDEIIARFVNPMASHARDIVNYKYFMGGLGGSRAKADEYLREEKGKNSNKIHYAIHPSREFPGKFVLSYLPGSKVQHEFLTVTPDGFRYRQMSFQTLNQALKWFKEHFKDAPPSVSTPVVTPKTHAARTPFATTPGFHGKHTYKISLCYLSPFNCLHTIML
jgi:transcription elongation factor SPT6